MTADHAAIRVRLDAITPGPWKIIGGGEYVSGPDIGIGYDEGVRARDAEFIAHAPEDIGTLLAENEALQARIDAALEVIGDLDADLHINFEEDNFDAGIAEATTCLSAALTKDQPAATSEPSAWRDRHGEHALDMLAVVAHRRRETTPEPPHLDPEPWVLDDRRYRHGGRLGEDRPVFAPREHDETSKPYRQNRADYEAGS